MNNETKNYLTQVQEDLKKAIKSKNTHEILSNYILYYQQKDLIEYQEEKETKSYYLSNFIKKEMIKRFVDNNYKKTSFTISTKATKALVGLAFIVQDNTFSFELKPLDKETYLLSFIIKFENMKNNLINWYNNELVLDIPLNPEIEEEKDDFELWAEQQLAESRKLKLR